MLGVFDGDFGEVFLAEIGAEVEAEAAFVGFYLHHVVVGAKEDLFAELLIGEHDFEQGEVFGFGHGEGDVGVEVGVLDAEVTDDAHPVAGGGGIVDELIPIILRPKVAKTDPQKGELCDYFHIIAGIGEVGTEFFVAFPLGGNGVP